MRDCTRGLCVDAMLPAARWPDQIEVVAGRYFVRPRYEVIRKGGQRRIAHANVERTDLKPDPMIRDLEKTMGKGYIMPLPILPRDAFSTTMIPTPMATWQHELPLRAEMIDAPLDRALRGARRLAIRQRAAALQPAVP